MGLQYKFIWLYRLLIPLIHRRSVKQDFYKAVGKNVSVFDVACGFGQTSHYLDASTRYSGIDLNKKFVQHAQKRGKDVKLANIFESSSYKHSDVITLVDIIHHMPESKLPALFNNIFRFAGKKVVILEPAFFDLKNRFGLFGGIIDWLFKKLDSDGFNTIERWYSEAEYKKMFDERFGSKHGSAFDVTVKKVWPYNLIVYSRK